MFIFRKCNFRDFFFELHRCTLSFQIVNREKIQTDCEIVIILLSGDKYKALKEFLKS